MDMSYRVFNDGRIFVDVKDLRLFLYKDLNIVKTKEQKDYISMLISAFEKVEVDLKNEGR